MNLKILFVFNLIFLLFCVQPSQEYSADLDKLCLYYNNTLQIAQLTRFNSIALVYLCPQLSPRPTQFIESLISPIISFDLHVSDNYLIYLTKDSSLYIANLDPTRNESTKLYQKLTPLVNDTKLSTVEPIWTYTDQLQPQQIVLDWIHGLLYLVDQGGSFYVSSMYELDRTVSILNRERVNIQKLLLCPQLYMLVWQEVQWDGGNYNTIQIAQQDGTEVKSIYQSKTFIQDLVIDQHTLAVYFITSDFLGVISLKKYHTVATRDTGESHVEMFKIRSDIKHFAILGPYIIKIQSPLLTFQDLREESESLTIPFKFTWNSRVQNEFKLIHKYSQPHSDPICPLTYSESNTCKDICLPNGYVAKFTCLCYNNNKDCPEAGHHHEDDEEQEREVQDITDQDIVVRFLKPESSIIYPNLTTDTPANHTIVDSHLAEDLWDSAHDHEYSPNATEIENIPRNDLEVSKPVQKVNQTNIPKIQNISIDLAKIFSSDHPNIPEIIQEFNQTKFQNILNVSENQNLDQQNQTISDQLYLIENLQSKSTTFTRLIWFIGKRTISAFTVSPSSKNRALWCLDRWLQANQKELIIALAIGLFVLIALAVFSLFFLIATLPGLSSRRAVSIVKPKKTPSSVVPESSGSSSCQTEVSIISVNQLYMEPNLVEKELHEGTFHDREPLGFEDSFVSSPKNNHWTILDSEQNSSWCKLSVSSPSSNSPSTSQEMTTFENWEYSSPTGFNASSTALLVAPGGEEKSKEIPLYL